MEAGAGVAWTDTTPKGGQQWHGGTLVEVRGDGWAVVEDDADGQRRLVALAEIRPAAERPTRLRLF